MIFIIILKHTSVPTFLVSIGYWVWYPIPIPKYPLFLGISGYLGMGIGYNTRKKWVFGIMWVSYPIPNTNLKSRYHSKYHWHYFEKMILIQIMHLIWRTWWNWSIFSFWKFRTFILDTFWLRYSYFAKKSVLEKWKN